MTPAVSFKQVSRHFGAVRAVDAVDLDIGEGEFFAMLGPSGSGKTTCLRLIAGFEQPTSGRIEIFGERAEGVPPYRRNVNTVFQDYALFPHLNVLDNVAYGLMVKGVGKAERQREAEAALEMVKLPGYGARRPGQLSGGQRQRVALARALVNRPKVLLLDEPLGALDLKLRENMQEELKSLQKSLGITFVFVTHDQGEALSMADRIAVFNDGTHHAGRHARGHLPAAEFALRRRFRRLLQRAAARLRRPPRRRAPLGEPAAGSGAHRRQADGIAATVVSRSYLGGTTRLGLDVEGQRINALLPAGQPLPAEGESVRIGFTPADLHLMDDAG